MDSKYIYSMKTASYNYSYCYPIVTGVISGLLLDMTSWRVFPPGVEGVRSPSAGRPSAAVDGKAEKKSLSSFPWRDGKSLLRPSASLEMVLDATKRAAAAIEKDFPSSSSSLRHADQGEFANASKRAFNRRSLIASRRESSFPLCGVRNSCEFEFFSPFSVCENTENFSGVASEGDACILSGGISGMVKVAVMPAFSESKLEMLFSCSISVSRPSSLSWSILSTMIFLILTAC